MEISTEAAVEEEEDDCESMPISPGLNSSGVTIPSPTRKWRRPRPQELSMLPDDDEDMDGAAEGVPASVRSMTSAAANSALIFTAHWFGARQFDHDAMSVALAETPTPRHDILSPDARVIMRENFRTRGRRGSTSLDVLSPQLPRRQAARVSPQPFGEDIEVAEVADFMPEPPRSRVELSTEKQVIGQPQEKIAGRASAPAALKPGGSPLPKRRLKKPRAAASQEKGRVARKSQGVRVLIRLTQASSKVQGYFTNAYVSGEAQEELMTQHRPVFVVFQAVLALLLWLGFAIAEFGFAGLGDARAGLDSVSLWSGGGWSHLLLHRDCHDLRPELWRWLTYQYTHGGIFHVFANAAMVLLFGIPLEGFHGHLRIAAIFNFGVVGGACFHLARDPHAMVIGMSAGCYALIGMHLADLVLNWSRSRYRHIKVLILGLFTACDAASVIWRSHVEADPDMAAYTHLGGYLMGFLTGLVMARNLQSRKCEGVLQVFAFLLTIVLLSACLTFALEWPPRGLGQEVAWCWARQVSNETLFGTWEYQCVRCASEACIRNWEPKATEFECM